MDYLGKGAYKENCAQSFREKLFVRMEHFLDILFQLMKHGINMLYLHIFSVIQLVESIT